MLRATATTTGAVLTHRGGWRVLTYHSGGEGDGGGFSYSRCRAPIESGGFACMFVSQHITVIITTTVICTIATSAATTLVLAARSSSTWTRSYIITNLTSTATMTTTTSIGSTRLIGDRRVGLAFKFSYLIRYSGKKNSSLPPRYSLALFSSREEFDCVISLIGEALMRIEYLKWKATRE